MQRPMHAPPRFGGMAGGMGYMPPMYGGAGPMGRGGPMQMGYAPRYRQRAPVQDDDREAEAEYDDEDYEAELETPAAAAAGGQQLGGMGMDKAMIDKLLTSDDPKWRNSKFLQFIDKVSKGEIEFHDNQAVHKPASAEDLAQQERDAAEDEVDLNMQEGAPGDWAQSFLAEQGVSSIDEWVQKFSTGQDAASQQQWADQMAQHSAEQAKDPEYVLPPVIVDHDDPFAEGVRLLNAGQVGQAIMHFEAAVTQDMDNAEAWRYLGQAQAENENESAAIAALLKCISIDPYNLKALMMLGVSYTNDFEEGRALNYLKTWLLHHPDYQGAIEEQAAKVQEYEDFYADGSARLDKGLHGEVLKMFNQASVINPQDADLQVVLGVLFHLSDDYDKAVESFKRAVQINPDDATIWNKLGATLANSSRSPEAVHAYQRALQLRPHYVRSLSNLAISYANQGMHEDAARTYLTTLKHNPNASNVWSYLRMSFSRLERPDLVKLTETKDVNAFRGKFDF